jgi:hypothetical protein
MIQVVLRLLAERLPRLVTVGDFRGVDAEEAEADLGLIAGESRDGIAVAHTLDLDDDGAGGAAWAGWRMTRRKQTAKATAVWRTNTEGVHIAVDRSCPMRRLASGISRGVSCRGLDAAC